jgi:hypothetical protein
MSGFHKRYMNGGSAGMPPKKKKPAVSATSTNKVFAAYLKEHEEWADESHPILLGVFDTIEGSFGEADSHV